jgi:hypothetical protein
MNEEKARLILGSRITEDGDLYDSLRWLFWDVGDSKASLDDSFTADELEAIAWWMKNKNIKQ